MSPKSEKLARELIALRVKYSDADFRSALDLISSGALFEHLVEAVVRTEGRVTRTDRAGRQRVASPRKSMIDQEAELEHWRFVTRDLPDLSAFLMRFVAREVLTDSASLRAFSEILGIQLPKKMPPRIRLAGRLVSALRRLPEDERKSLIEQAVRLGDHRSSLQLWSDVIVKRPSGELDR